MANIHNDVSEFNALTDFYLRTDKGKPWDTLNKESWAINYFCSQKKGLYESVEGAKTFDFPRIIGGVFSRSFDREDETIDRAPTVTPLSAPTNYGKYDAAIVGDVSFPIRHIMSSVKVIRDDRVKNKGAAQRVKLVKTRTDALLKAQAEAQAMSLWWAHNTDHSANAETLGYQRVMDGIMMCCYAGNLSAFQGTNYGGNASAAGWLGKRETNSGVLTPISFSKTQALRRTVKIRDGAGGKPDLCLMGEELFGALADYAETMVRVTDNKKALDWGFDNLVHRGCMYAIDDFVPDDNTVAMINSKYFGFQVLSGGHNDVQDWEIVPTSTQDVYKDVYLDGNWVTPARDAHIVHTKFSD